MKRHLITLADGKEHTVHADRWYFDADDVMHFYKDRQEVFSRQWKLIQFIYTEDSERGANVEKRTHYDIALKIVKDYIRTYEQRGHQETVRKLKQLKDDIEEAINDKR